MSFLFVILGAACFAYYFNVSQASFSIIWMIGGCVCLAAAGIFLYMHCCPNRKRLPLWFTVPICTTVAAGLAVFAIVEALIIGSMFSEPVKGLDYVIVLGAQVRGDKVGNTLRKRLDMAIDYLEKNPQTKVILSGGQEPGMEKSEAEVMYEYMTYNGIAPDRLIIERRSHSTVENIAYSRLVFKYKPEAKVGIITSNFHVYRAKAIAKRWGIENVVGISAPTDWVYQVHQCVRECFAILKDKLMGNM